jgi:hypothetical protein
VSVWWCDGCGEAISHEDEHTLELSDPASGQELGKYHDRCFGAGLKYLRNGLPLRLMLVHPDACGHAPFDACDLHEVAP